MLSVTPSTEDQVKFLLSLNEKLDVCKKIGIYWYNIDLKCFKVDFWNHVKGVDENVLILLSPQVLKIYESMFDQFNISFKVLVENMQKWIFFNTFIFSLITPTIMTLLSGWEFKSLVHLTVILNTCF